MNLRHVGSLTIWRREELEISKVKQSCDFQCVQQKDVSENWNKDPKRAACMIDAFDERVKE